MPKIKTKGHIHETLTGYDFTRDHSLTAVKAIRKKCLECMCGNVAEVPAAISWIARSGRGAWAGVLKTGARMPENPWSL